MNEVLLEASGIEKSFPGVRALDGVSLQVRSGELLALLGENGAGKSTLMKILAGVFPADAGRILIGGEAVEFRRPFDAQQQGIGIVHQELSLIPQLSVAENIFLGREPRSRTDLIHYRRLYRETRELLTRLDLSIDPSLPVGNLRIGQQQLIEIARALSTNTRVLILDEPTSSLSAHEVEVLFKVIRQLKAAGVGIIYITHKFEELAGICDQVSVLRDGRVVGNAPFSAYTRAEIVRLMAGRKSAETFEKVSRPGTDELLRLEGFTLPGAGAGRRFDFADITFSLHRGEVLGIFGLVGAGRSELLEAIFGLHSQKVAGTLHLEGEPRKFHSPTEAIAAGLALAPEDRKRDGVILSMSVGANTSLPSLSEVYRFGLIDSQRETSFIRPFIERFRVKTPSLAQPIVNLSGGNQQKVILAKWLATGPKVLLLDEPTRGIDINAKQEIYSFIDELAARGLGLIVVSSELPEVLALSDRILVLCEGRLAASFDRTEATPEKLLAAALPTS